MLAMTSAAASGFADAQDGLGREPAKRVIARHKAGKLESGNCDLDGLRRAALNLRWLAAPTPTARPWWAQHPRSSAQ
jgi:hypothetical protein